MKNNTPVLVFGEALFDCFPDGEQVLGGAPFNVAWHLQALGDKPFFISRIGTDRLGQKLLATMHDWGMNTQSIQTDPTHQTGQVGVKLIANEPHYTITPDCAYDFISSETMNNLPDNGILYHGTLGLRQSISRKSFSHLTKQASLSIFLDVNLRTPWWQKHDVFNWLTLARWVKVNEDELQQLGFVSTDLHESMYKFQQQFKLEQLIVTRGEKGAIILANNGKIYEKTPPKIDDITDTVGAGDGFSAMYIHGLRERWPIEKALDIAQQFAGNIISLRGATTTTPQFYRKFI